jgi:hypothetical protein
VGLNAFDVSCIMLQSMPAVLSANYITEVCLQI